MRNLAKYRNKRVEADGERFDSLAEYARWKTLVLLQRAGAISGLERQKAFLLIPPQDGERAAKYVADFFYYEDGIKIVEDKKGYRTKDYILKRKLMKFIHGITIRET